MVDISVVGSYGAGLTMRLGRAPGAGETVSGGQFAEEHGGKGSNQAVAAARLSATVSLLTAVGDDHYGRAAAELWRTEGVDARHVAIVDQPTMVGFITVEPSGENRISIAPGALEAVTPELVDTFADEIAGSKTLLVSMEIPEGGVIRALEIARDARVLTVLNPAPARVLPDKAWDLIDILTPNESEAPVLLGMDSDHGLSPLELADLLLARLGDGRVALTLGSAGALIASPGQTPQLVPPVKVAAVDTTGAGDAYSAALAVALTEGLDFAAAAGLAATAGAFAVRTAGVIPALPRRSDVFGINDSHISKGLGL
jgi:ribokinase